LVPRYWIDRNPGQPFPLVAEDAPETATDPAQHAHDASELRRLVKEIL
jgi:hypothetical protein